MASPAFQTLLATHAGQATARQLALGDFLGERPWRVDLQAGECRFGNDLRFPIQVLGTESEADGSWLWAWANTVTPIPQSLLQASDRLRQLGADQEVQEFTEAHFDLEEEGHALAAVASGLIGDCCYYRGPYEGGAVYFLLQDLPSTLLWRVDAPRVLTVLQQAVSAFAVNGRLLARSFLAAQGFALTEAGDTMTVRRDRDVLVVRFDALDRIVNLSGTLAPGTPALAASDSNDGGKRWWQFWK